MRSMNFCRSLSASNQKKISFGTIALGFTAQIDEQFSGEIRDDTADHTSFLPDRGVTATRAGAKHKSIVRLTESHTGHLPPRRASPHLRTQRARYRSCLSR